MKRLLKKAGLAFIFLQVLVLNQAYAEPKGLEYFVGYIVIQSLLPAFIGLVVLLIANKARTALIIITIIWAITIIAMHYINSKTLDMELDDFSLFWNFYIWVPMTIIELIALTAYFIQRRKSNN